MFILLNTLVPILSDQGTLFVVQSHKASWGLRGMTLNMYRIWGRYWIHFLLLLPVFLLNANSSTIWIITSNFLTDYGKQFQFIWVKIDSWKLYSVYMCICLEMQFFSCLFRIYSLSFCTCLVVKCFNTTHYSTHLSKSSVERGFCHIFITWIQSEW